jgi:aspartate-semialdehyde dehydrogenase
MSASYQTLSNPRVAIVGATGAVGIELIRCLEERNFPLSGLRLLASKRSVGRTLPFRGQEIAIEELTEENIHDIDLALFSAGSGPSKHFGPLAVRRGAVVVDNSSAFRMEDAVPLIVPEINPEALEGHGGIIANPNCAAIISMTPLWPLHRRNPIRRVIVPMPSTCSATIPRSIPRPAIMARNPRSSPRPARSSACRTWPSPPPASESPYCAPTASPSRWNSKTR